MLIVIAPISVENQNPLKAASASVLEREGINGVLSIENFGGAGVAKGRTFTLVVPLHVQ
jgi:hypothetical protein